MKSKIRWVFHRGKCAAICHSQDDGAKSYMHSSPPLSISTRVNGVFTLCLPPKPELIFNSLAVTVPVWWLEVLTTARNWLLQSWYLSYYQPIQFLVPAQLCWARWKCCNPLPNPSVSPGRFFLFVFFTAISGVVAEMQTESAPDRLKTIRNVSESLEQRFCYDNKECS